MIIRDEAPGDISAIRLLVSEAFASAPHASGTEAAIVDALRAAGALTVSLVAVEDDSVIGHVAISPVSIAGAADWYGLGPVAVVPGRQGRGVGSGLIRRALLRLRDFGAAGCVVLGDPVYYARFGFGRHPGLTYPNAPAPYFQALHFTPHRPTGQVAYHPAFAL